jgi:Kef-type K+ transport system membrane component KefB
MPLTLPLAAADTASVLTDLFVVLLAAKLGDEVFKRIGQPAIVGEILGGVLVGPSVLGLVEVGEVLRVFSELGIVFLLFWVGLKTRLSEMRAVGRDAVAVGSAGVIVPFLAGIGFGLALGEDTDTSVFLGAALAATSAGITSATFLDLGIARTRAARTVLGAAVVDDILALILLSVAVGMAADGGVDAGKIALALGVAIAFVAFVALGGTRLLSSRPRLLEAPQFAESPLLPAVLLCLGLAAFAANIGLAALIGAFLAGIIVAETKDHTSIEEEVKPLYAFFPRSSSPSSGSSSTSAPSSTATRSGCWRRSRCWRRGPSSCPPTSLRAGWAETKPRSSASAWSPAARWGSSSPRSAPPRGSSTPSCSPWSWEWRC